MKGKLNANRHPTIRLEERPIAYCPSVKYLGIVLDDKNTFIPHVEYVRDEVKKIFAKLTRVTRKEWGLRPAESPLRRGVCGHYNVRSTGMGG